MKKVFLVGFALVSVGAFAFGANWSRSLSGTGDGSSRYVAESSAKDNLNRDAEENTQACQGQGGTPQVTVSPDSHCQQFYPVGNWRCNVVGRFTCYLP